MFSYLRPHHKRTPSNPTSPAEQAHSFEPPLHHAHPQRYQDAGLQDLPPISPPPSLPVIARVSSAEPSLGGSGAGTFEPDSRTQYTDPSRNTTRPRDTYGFSNHQRMPYAETQRPESAGNAIPTKYTSQQYTRLQTGMNQERLSRPKPGESQSFVTASDLQNRPLQSARRPNGVRLPSPPPAPATNYSYHEPVQRSGKTRLNLLNPMSLLARRRTSQAVTQLSPESLVSNRAANEKVFDPRIKGTVVHDFSAPRTRRNVSYSDVRTLDTTINSSRQFQRSPNGDINATDDPATSPWSGGNHTPVFTENFEEEQYPAAGPHVRKASDLTDLPLPKPPYAQGTQKPAESNSMSKSNEEIQKQIQGARKISARKPVPNIPPPVPPKEGELPQEPRRVSIDPSSAPPKSTSSKKGRPRNVSEVSAKDAAIPKHMKSTSSRFSFDMIGAAEQERLLEDRHRKRALEKKAERDEDDRLEDEFEDNYDYDNMDDDDGLEERIPGINADLDEDDFEERIPGVNADLDEDDFEERIPGVNAEMDDDDLEERIPGADAESDGEDPYIFEKDDGNLAGFTFQQSTLVSPMSPSSPGMVGTPRDANGEVIGFAMTKNSPNLPEGFTRESTIRPPSTAADPTSEAITSGVQGLGLEGLESLGSAPQLPEEGPEVKEFPDPATLDDDDFYFDDGIIGGPGDLDAPSVEFDESVFDAIDTDQYGRPLRSLSSLPTLYSPPMLTADPSPSFKKIVESSNDSHDALSPDSLPQVGGLAPQPSISGPHPPNPSIAPSLTQDTLAAYQSALAAAACNAAASGKFRRDSTPPNPTPSEQEDPHPGLVTDSSHTSHYEPFSPSYEIEDDFDYDDAMEDDAIIAAANAEALANDCDGFYGQEFGFYSAPAASEAEYANGGYFGPRGAEGVNRSQSGRVVSREPNLTPITERSEYSNRNSFMSLSMPMHGPGSISSPGLSQLAGMMRSPDYEGDMSLDALLKLRRGAWGGSQASLHSSNGSPRSAGGLEENSPVGQLPPWAQGGAVGNPVGGGGGHWRKNSGFSLASETPSGVGTGVQSESSSMPGSPTMTMSMSNLAAVKEDERPVEEKEKIKEVEKEKDKGIRKHRYTGSAESISYLKEGDPVTGERWILERRRTGEGGEVEFLGREVVSGGRI